MYASCEGICPGTTSNLRKVHQRLGERAGRDVFLYSITIKPNEDTPDVLELASAPEGARLTQLGPATPDHTIFTKRLPCHVPLDDPTSPDAVAAARLINDAYAELAQIVQLAFEGLARDAELEQRLPVPGQRIQRLAQTLLLPDEGYIEVLGYDAVRQPMEVQRLINRVSVEASFFKKMSAAENLNYAARFYGMTPAETRERIPEILGKVVGVLRVL